MWIAVIVWIHPTQRGTSESYTEKKKKERFPRIIPLLICRKKEESVALKDSLFYQCCFQSMTSQPVGLGYYDKKHFIIDYIFENYMILTKRHPFDYVNMYFKS